MSGALQWGDYTGSVRSSTWLDCLAIAQSHPELIRFNLGSDLDPEGVAGIVCRAASSRELPALLLDAHSVIENGELSRRCHRSVVPSPGQAAVLDLLSGPYASRLQRCTPREFEAIVAFALAEIGFDRIELRRYSKDGGADIFAVLVGEPREELVVVEVKHGKGPVGLQAFDRLKGASIRLGADRALMVCSSHFTRDAKSSYQYTSDYFAAYSWKELLAILGSARDWTRTPRGLWTKEPLADV